MQHVLFDLDGTLTDPAVGIVRSFQHALAEIGGRSWSDADLRQFIGPPLREVFGLCWGRTKRSRTNVRSRRIGNALVGMVCSHGFP